MFDVLRRGSKGSAVKRWQNFLLGQGFNPKGTDGVFGKDTATATRAFQAAHGLPETGETDNATLGQAALLGFQVASDDDPAKRGPNFPPPPDFRPIASTAERQALFGRFAFRHRPLPGNFENIEITDDWEARNLVSVPLPQLAGVTGAPASRRVRFHQLAAGQLVELWAAWDRAGLIDRVVSWHGSFVPRFQRGSVTALSNHAFGSAFDINVDANKLGAIPALVGEPGCVRELVRLANKHGFYWGGHFQKRPDGMHFEVATLQ